ncbi:YvrJ family protein [Alteribacillus iranensis]|uniref:YvrJ protein family protein n=1 Tax=Alteribacillus iranensis TaxID=930128 RepID=A0A1I2BTU7_9BACI|nr:YvrJ family protein [Alteribacillus iranensis]SFE59467.1 YvrJ protein family protein [Alteribacillus iranensis]
MEEWMALISNVGFPIVVASYLLIRLEPIIKGLQESIASLALAIAAQDDAHITKLIETMQTKEKNFY